MRALGKRGKTRKIDYKKRCVIIMGLKAAANHRHGASGNGVHSRLGDQVTQQINFSETFRSVYDPS